jgi:hypothetical protein
MLSNSGHYMSKNIGLLCNRALQALEGGFDAYFLFVGDLIIKSNIYFANKCTKPNHPHKPMILMRSSLNIGDEVVEFRPHLNYIKSIECER